MIVTTYTCDRCKHNQTTGEQMWQIGIAVQHFGSVGYSSHNWGTSYFQHHQLWCRKCVETVGLFAPSLTPKGVEPIPLPTFEDMLRNIIREEIQDNP